MFLFAITMFLPTSQPSRQKANFSPSTAISRQFRLVQRV